MKIIIIGGGITGLATYLYLRKILPDPSSHKIIIYEKSITPEKATETTNGPFENIVGAGLGLNPNGMRVLRDLDTSIYEAVIAQGYQVSYFKFKTAGNWTLGEQTTKDGREPEEFCTASSRHGLQKCLMNAVPSEDVVCKEVREVQIRNDARSVVVFEDGTRTEEVDIVVGADGLRSVVKRSLFGEHDHTKYAIKYQGTLGVGGFITIPEDVRYDRRCMVFTMGSTGSFGYAGASQADPRHIMYWSSYESDTAPKRGEVTPQDVQKLLRERHSDWKDPVIRYIIQHSTVDSIWPMWITPKLPHWGREGVVLMGDAAHAITPNTGQGASMGLQDAQMFATLLAESLHKLGDEKTAIKTSITGLYDLRHVKLAEIQRKAINSKGSSSKPSIIKASVMYIILWMVINIKPIGKLLYGSMPELINQDATKEVSEYLDKKTKRMIDSQ